jgi:hypothetical protein
VAPREAAAFGHVTETSASAQAVFPYSLILDIPKKKSGHKTAAWSIVSSVDKR